MDNGGGYVIIAFMRIGSVAIEGSKSATTDGLRIVPAGTLALFKPCGFCSDNAAAFAKGYGHGILGQTYDRQ